LAHRPLTVYNRASDHEIPKRAFEESLARLLLVLEKTSKTENKRDGSVVNQTQNLDRLAREGMRFNRCFAVNSICTPSRATILTGTYSHVNGVPVFNRFDGSQPTAPKYLQAAGYYTGMIGKWHLGSDPTGFDKWIVLPGQGVYFDPDFVVPEGRIQIKGSAQERTEG